MTTAHGPLQATLNRNALDKIFRQARCRIDKGFTNMKELRAYNAGSERILSPRLVVIDAAREPIMVRKIFKEGPGAQARNGIWLANFRGVPFAKPASEFDLIYLDEDYRVLHAVEVSLDGEFEPFKGNAASALILLPGTIGRSKTFTGDRITIEPSENQSIEPQPAASPKPAAHRPRQIVTAASAKSFNVPSNGGLNAGSATTRASGSLMRRGRVARDGSSIVRPASPPAAAPPAADIPLGAKRMIAPIPENYAPRIPEPTAPAAGIQFQSNSRSTPTPLRLAPDDPAPLAELPSKIDQPLIAHSFPASRFEPSLPAQPPSPQQPRVEYQTQAPAKTYKPAMRPEDQTRESSPSGSNPEAVDGLDRLSNKIVSWLYPEKDSQANKRRAPRIDAPRLVAYYFAGGPPTPHEIRNISAVGFYMVTDQRWMLGTVIRVTIQPLEREEADSSEGVTVYARVVRWGPDGGGFEFVFPGREDSPGR
jgi:hypothetical protein